MGDATRLRLGGSQADGGVIPASSPKRRKLGLDMHGGAFGLPADFLIAPDGHMLAVKYGDHAHDQWSVDELLAFAEGDKRRYDAAA